MNKTVIDTKKAPSAIGPYIQGASIENFVFTSGQLGIDPTTGEYPEGGVVAQAHQSMKNVEAVLVAGGSDLNKIIKTTIFVKDLGDFAAVNEVYGSYFKEGFPARSCVEVARLPKDGLVEIECIAYK